MGSLADLLQANREKLIRRWTREVERRFVREPVTEPELTDSLPAFIDILVEGLRRPPIHPEDVVFQQLAEVAQRHGHERYRLGFDLNTVVREYGLFRDCVLALIEESDTTVELREVRVLTEQVVIAVAEAATQLARDTQRALSAEQERTRAAVEAADIGIWEYNIETAELRGDARCAVLLGIAPGVATRLPSLLARIHPDDRQATERAFSSAVALRNDASLAAEFRSADDAGLVDRFIRVRGKPTLDGDRPHRLIIGTALDITEDRRREEMRERFIGVLAHDLRGPLTAIVVSAATIERRGNLDETQRRALERIRANTERMRRMISDLLDFAVTRLGGRLPISPQKMDLNEAVRDVVEVLGEADGGRRISVECEGDGRGDWDPDRIAQVVTNLVRNALKYSPPDSPIRVATGSSSDGMMLEVHNTGPQVPSADMPVLFDAFRRGRTAAKTDGVGLGLYIVREIVRAHGGRIDVRSTKEGTSFVVMLPRNPPPQLGL